MSRSISATEIVTRAADHDTLVEHVVEQIAEDELLAVDPASSSGAIDRPRSRNDTAAKAR